jgi:hypothetical protein
MENVTLETALNTLIEKIKASYANWGSNDRDPGGVRERMIAEFNEQISYTVGKKYIKILTRRSVWGFVMLNDDKQFARGDILKAASYNAPARNFKRGNVFGNYDVNWTGA